MGWHLWAHLSPAATQADSAAVAAAVKERPDMVT
jgi:hypothetical protein